MSQQMSKKHKVYQLWARGGLIEGFPTLNKLIKSWEKTLEQNLEPNPTCKICNGTGRDKRTTKGVIKNLTPCPKCIKLDLEARVYTDNEYVIINDKMPKRELEFKSAKGRDKKIYVNAAYFTVIRFLGIGKYERHEFKQVKMAIQKAKEFSEIKKGNYLIYAVDERGFSALYAIKRYKKEVEYV